ncbi:hypothetical protein [Natronorubrum sp. A-ect3]|uniref:hypothetical protein n=1 Tax=Natronorubrum sp. A-ect3 TaxID=3242698 RepID=UPI00359D1E47
MESDKPLWVREPSCPSCGSEADRDENASYNVLKLGLEELGVEYDVDAVVGLGKAKSTSSESFNSDGLRKSADDFRAPAETALPTGASVNDDSSFRVVPAKRVCRGNLDRLSDSV